MGGWLVFGLIALVILGMIFLALRELVLWYWKIDKSVQLLEEIRDVLVEIRDRGNPVRVRAPLPEEPEISVFSWARRTFRKDASE